MGNPIKVCHFTSVHPWNDIRIFQKQCISLANNGFEVFLVAPDAKDGIHNNVNVIGVKSQKKGRLYRFFKFRKKIYKKALEINADIYHFHDPELLPFAKKLQRKGKKVIYDSHEDVPMQILSKPWIKPFVLRKLISFFYNLYEKRTCRKISGIVSVLDSITEKFANDKRITIFNYPKIESQDENLISDIVLPEKFLIVYNGGLTKIRGIDNIVASMNFLSDEYRLLLMGRWESDLFEKYCMGLQGWEKVEYLGMLNFNTCYSILKKSDIGIVMFKSVPNNINSLPNKAFEFISVSLPMIMSNFPLWKQEFGNYAHFVDPENPEELARKISEIKNNYVEEKPRVEAESKKIMLSKTWLSQEKKLVDFYNKILK
ncbi:MAG: glycosyltransferase [Bacteroidetes bacterium]|nr:glycosyltransferase [Bacteroidota bacterium]